METQEYNIIDIIYPVGSIYMSVNTTDPSSLFPNTTWEKIENRFLLSSGSSYNSGDTGGSKDAVVVSHNHAQSSHNHIPNAEMQKNFVTTNDNVDWFFTNQRAYVSGSGEYRYAVTKNAGTSNIAEPSGTNWVTPTINSSGVDGTDKNMPPYLVVNIWKRTN